MRIRSWVTVLCLVFSFSRLGFAQEYIIKVQDSSPQALAKFMARNGGSLSLVSEAGMLYKWTVENTLDSNEFSDSNVIYTQPNRILSLPPNPSIEKNRKALLPLLKDEDVLDGPAYPDNPAIQAVPTQTPGADPLLKNAWGIFKTNANLAWNLLPKGKDIVVAVTDTGVDYNHPDLIRNMWRNPKEIDGDGIDNDGNGYIDDVVGWDFAANDNKPYDLTLSLMEILLQGGNPGHGTHVAGVIGAAYNNSLGTAGVAPDVKIMALRFLTEKGQGTTEGAIKAIDYAVKNGANIINASWGGEKGEDDDAALKEAIQRAEAAGVLFIAAAGNGRVDQMQGKAVGFDNDSDAKPMLPASFDLPNMVTVAAVGENDALAEFSNWGAKSVKIAAPGVKILSTVPGNRYQDTVIDIGPIKATWDGTSMATPFVSGALAALWSKDRNLKGLSVRQNLLSAARPSAALAGKVMTSGVLEMGKMQ